MIDAIKTFSKGYRAVGIKDTTGMDSSGWIATIMLNGRMLGESADYGDGAPVLISFKDDADVKALREHAKQCFPDGKYELAESFLGYLVNYEIAVKGIKSKAKKFLLVADESRLDSNGVSTTYTKWNISDTPENRSKVLAQSPATKFLNDELEHWETIKKPRG